MKASQQLISHIKRSESCVLKAYKDAKGVWTIGYGHTRGVKPGDRITQYQADRFLAEDLAEYEAAASMVEHVSTQGKFDAITDFMYNCGIGAFNNSTLRRYIESNRPTWEIQEQFLRWVNAGGKKQGGLVTRRIWEAARFNE